ncbi:pyruvate dehydrogenase complex dihydrolipoamide acetyltransferase [Synoicihabitans lomoniglobus]|uniref:Acetyltransferase component of pyruvate dehydrogenase complex n=1 Tax=Synoicihabitans lomoniglobus TaxID=2909285 RepID=A0AAF0I2N9_9BACT|nr:pyruvate dehydrogenase complex dihydrolipoamide acetyltransferase [Opitutaceae bacterium LMO-M01]WED66642.1 pyruvate dehydrogenase complex dihydrolipoamide acetyltransferase [Opitutaceae bacterium LMO-M01]
MADIIDMPKLSDTMTVGTLVKWLKKEGDVVATGDMLAEVETDKATMELESFFDGTILKIFADEGAQVEIGEPLCAVGEAGEEVEAPAKKEKPAPAAEEKAPEDEKPAAESTPAATPPPPPPAPAPSAPTEPGKRVKISPLARKLAAEKGIDPSRITGTGTGGRIVRADVLDAEKNGVSGGGMSGSGHMVKGPIQEDKVVAVSGMRGTIARRLVESKTQIPHFYLDIEVDAGPLLALRAQLNSGLESEGIKLSVNDFILKASAEALRKVPAVNCSWEGKEVRHHSRAHVSFAVALPDGLITPVVFDAHVKSVFDISVEAKTLGKAAKAKKLQPNQYTGGTFCVSNLGMMGINSFKAIINPPNAGILAVGTTVEKPVVVNGQITIGHRMNLTLSCDHRVVDGAVAAQFMVALREMVEKPALLLV